jgi:hypothetical protein
MKPAHSATTARTNGREHQHCRISTGHLKEHRLRRSADAERADEAHERSHNRHDRHLAQHHAANAVGRGTQRHAEADLARALRDGIGQDAIETDRRQQRRQQRECRRERRHHAIEIRVVADLLGEGLERLDGEIRIEPLHHGCDLRHRARDIARRWHVEVHPAESLILSIRHEELRRDRLLHVAVLRILDDSDDRRVECAAVAFSRGPSHRSADGGVPKAELPGERLVDEGNLRRVHRVGIRELASGNEGMPSAEK